MPLSLDRRAALGLLAAAALAPRTAHAAAPLTSVPAPDRELRVPVRGGAIHVRVNGPFGAAKAPLLFVHGGPGGTHTAGVPALAMSAERAVILYDQLDCGRSDTSNDPDNWTVERHVSEVDAIRAALNLKRLHLLGHSWGGTIAAEYAARRPAGLKSVILQGPLISTRRWIDDCVRLRGTLPPEVRAVLEEGDSTGRFEDEAYKKAEDVFYANFNRRGPAPTFLRDYGLTSPNRFNARLYQAMWGPNEFICNGTLRDYDATPLLPRIAAPTLYLGGRFDTGTPEANADYARITPGAEVQVIENASHGSQVEQPAAWLAAVSGWLTRFD